MYQLNFDLNHFLAQYWHKKPTVIKKGFVDFVDPISPEEIAGLAMEEEVDSRFVSNHNNVWQAQHGPFKEAFFSELTESHWQLIVQACNHWHTGSAELVSAFNSLPQWLFDDLMVCYSAPEGGVGPHIDQYDVFIIQGSGKRRWRVGDLDRGQYQESIQASALRQIEGFDAIIDEILEPGDILYIPPGFPHEGNTLEPSMSYSIGYRSPKEQELLSNFADYVLANDKGDVHLHNPEMSTQQHHGEIKTADLALLTQMLKSALNSERDVADFIATSLSHSRHQLDIAPPEDPYSEEEIFEHLDAQGVLLKLSGLRTLYNQDNKSDIYINGDKFSLCDERLLDRLCNHRVVTEQHININDQSSVNLLTQLVNLGYWYLD
ncbi:ribosomal protein uL16 3-hydroxylase [Vibrio sinaloensis]|uniref:ribosomal protein uL16 3-hydroxylase n=1 Tax=Photobacterium sp. (strain ATCC 43367) TaxID=379097 RepID=UPI0035EB6332